MRWFKFGVLIVAFLIGIYAVSMYYLMEESKSYKVEKEIPYPIDKVFPQFSNLQNLARWNTYFSGSKNLSIQFYQPYEGKDASMSFSDPKEEREGELFIRYLNPNKTIKYQLFEGYQPNPYNINLSFKQLPNNRTKVTYFTHSPKLPLWQRSKNLFENSLFVNNLDASMNSLAGILSNKVDKDHQLASIKYDSVMVVDIEAKLLLGVNVSTANKGDSWHKNVILNHNKVVNFVTSDLGKREDEFGFPVMINEPGNFKDREVSYYYGVPLPKRIGVNDNNFSFRTVNASKYYIYYYKGKFEGRTKVISQLLLKAKKDSMRNGELQTTFLEPPVDGGDVNLKLALPVFK